MKSRRMKFTLLIVAATLIIFGWLTIGIEEEAVPYVTVAELQAKQGTREQDRFRLGGLVEAGSIAYSSDRLSVDFVVVQGGMRLPVHYSGLTPDLFKDEAEVIIEGVYHDSIFSADNLMTKCASRYGVE